MITIIKKNQGNSKITGLEHSQAKAIPKTESKFVNSHHEIIQSKKLIGQYVIVKKTLPSIVKTECNV